jgi:hypothetical protein
MAYVACMGKEGCVQNVRHKTKGKGSLGNLGID